MELLLINNLRTLNPWILGIIASSVLGGATIVYLQSNTTSKQVAVEAAPVTAVVALGHIEPDGEVIKLSVPNAQDSRVNQILVKEGAIVKANQVIAILQEIARCKADLRDAQTDLRLRQAELNKIQQGDAKKAQLTAQRATITRLEAQLQTETVQRKAAITSTEATITKLS